jgi:hypothetical protein
MGIGYFDFLPNSAAAQPSMTPSAAASARNTPYLHVQRSPSRPASRDSSVGWNSGSQQAMRSSTRHMPSASATSASSMAAPPMRRPASRLGLATGRSSAAGNASDLGGFADLTPTHVPPPHNSTGGARVLQKVKRRPTGGTDGASR